MYTVKNFRTKKAMKEAVVAGEEVKIFQPGPFGEPSEFYQGTQCIEGPHFPKPHSWYAEVKVKDGIITKVVG